MKTKMFKVGWLCLAWLAACSANEGGAKQVAGGQSGTDSEGSYSCVLDSPMVESIALDQAPAGVTCSPNSVFERFEGTQTFLCKEHDVSFTMSVTRGSSARRLTGKLYSDTGDSSPPTDCWAMSLDATVAIRSSDGRVDFERPSTLTVDHVCDSAVIEPALQVPEGKLRIELRDTELFVVFPATTTLPISVENCPRATLAMP